jgi:hypothetical protein
VKNTGTFLPGTAHPWRATTAPWLLAVAVFAIVSSSTTSWSQAAVAPRESTIKAAFLYKFAGFVEWPPGTFQRPNQPLVIAVSRDDDFHADLEQLVAGRTVEDRPVIVRKLAEGASTAGVHVLYLGERREARLREAIDATAGPIVIVTEQSQGLRSGSVINFSTEGGRVRFSVSLAAAEARNLRLSARLLAVALVIEGRPR